MRACSATPGTCGRACALYLGAGVNHRSMLSVQVFPFLKDLLLFKAHLFITHVPVTCIAFACSCQSRDEQYGQIAARVDRQEALGQLGQEFDGIFFDTYSEYYEDMRCATTCWLERSQGRVSTARVCCMQASMCAI